jgi:hypothetical protein
MYNTVISMTKSKGLRDRLVGCAAIEGRADAPMWVDQNIWRLVNDVSWVEAYEYAENTKNRNVNQDTGDRDDVINDSMILSRVQAVIEEGSDIPTVPGPPPLGQPAV